MGAAWPEQLEQPLAGLRIQPRAIVGLRAEHEMLLELQALQLEDVELQPTRLHRQLLEHGDPRRDRRKPEGQLAQRCLQATTGIEHKLPQRMRQAIDVTVVGRRRLPLANQVVTTGGCRLHRGPIQVERQAVIIEPRPFRKHVSGQTPEQAGDAVELDNGLVTIQTQSLDHSSVERCQQGLLGLTHPDFDLRLQFLAQRRKRGVDLCWSSTGVIDFGDPSFDVSAAFDTAQDFIGGPKHAIEQLEFLGQELQNTLVSRVGVG